MKVMGAGSTTLLRHDAPTRLPSRTQAQLDTAWSFPGAKHSTRSSPRNLAILGALALHAGLAFINPDRGAVHVESQPLSLETFIPIEETIRELPEPEAEPLRHHENASASPIAPSQAMPTSAESGDLEEGPLPEDAAAELAASEFGDSDFQLPSGSGLALGRGSIARPGSGGTGLTGGTARNTSLSARDLSRPAIPPHLQPLIDANFPVAARLARVGGTVTVSAIIQEDGNPTDVRVVSVSPSGRGFGETCSRTVHEGPDWKPKLNRDGRPVASKVTYTCKFSLPEDIAGTVDGQAEGVGANRVWTKPAGG